jgi:hypothetical protein
LTVFPSKAIADLHAQIEWHERAIDEERAEWEDEVYGDEDLESILSDGTLNYIRELEDDLAILRNKLELATV